MASTLFTNLRLVPILFALASSLQMGMKAECVVVGLETSCIFLSLESPFLSEHRTDLLCSFAA